MMSETITDVYNNVFDMVETITVCKITNSMQQFYSHYKANDNAMDHKARK